MHVDRGIHPLAARGGFATAMIFVTLPPSVAIITDAEPCESVILRDGGAPGDTASDAIAARVEVTGRLSGLLSLRG